MLHPDMVDIIINGIAPEDFVTDFNRKVYEHLLTQLRAGQAPDLGVLGAYFTPAEMGRVVEIQNRAVSGENMARECADCMAAIREEKAKLGRGDPKEMDEARWADEMQELLRHKAASNRQYSEKGNCETQ